MIELVKDVEQLKAIHSYELWDVYPNIEISLTIFVIMPVPWLVVSAALVS